ncbi:response regulator [Polycladomyces sp. WAk]|uniref:Transcriptional regulatory protein n=1 Tax=Polycladomyces zharkentensis TaxID=2807616 RepID=A0ABS2WL92_9BACL|nr:response regulator [Polycladomyces sp. WAk]MBN2910050.1 response regulator [Polycladomyces sp. WAk]
MIRVLIVEDDPMVAEINRRYLTSVPGFGCSGIASNVTEALEFLRNNSVDLVMLDIFMPGKNGLQLLTEIRKEGKSVDVIVISAANDIQNIKQALRLGAVDYLIKPFTFERLKTALQTYQKEQEMIQEQNEWNQEELDKLLLHPDQTRSTSAKLPKGLTRETLQRVVKSIDTLKSGFTTEELARDIGISRVSARKYLKFLTEIGCLSVEPVYGTGGRPVYRYDVKQGHTVRIAPYLET